MRLIETENGESVHDKETRDKQHNADSGNVNVLLTYPTQTYYGNREEPDGVLCTL